MNRIIASTIVALSIAGPAANAAERPLERVNAPDHDPLYVDTSSIERNGNRVAFNYVLDVLAVAEARSTPGGWKSNEIEATIDCARRSFTSGRVTAYAGPRASGGRVGGYVPAAPERVTEKIAPNSTFSYLAEFVCSKY